MRRGFTLLEVLLVVGILGMIAGVSIPMYRKYQVRNDLDLTAQQITQALGRAQLLARSGRGASAWGLHVPSGTIFAGASHGSRNSAFDEAYPFPPTITPSGLSEVSFSPIDGAPNATGTIVLQAITGDRRTISITLTEEGITTNESDRLTVCHMQGNTCETKQITDNAWGGHQQHGDYLGVCRDRNGNGDLCD